MNLSIRISKLRRRKQWTQARLGMELGVSRDAVTKWECGTSVPHVDNIIAMCGVFNVDANHILGVESREAS